MCRYSRNARRCAKRERRYTGSYVKNEKRYARREARSSSSSNNNNNKHHCLHHHHQFHLMISIGSL
jgi:hypothetical protein